MAFYIKQNDTSPALVANLTDANGNAVDLTGCSVRFHMRKVGEAAAKVDNGASIVDADNGQVQYAWSAADTDGVGSCEAEFEVTFQGGEIETFPNNKFIQIEITDDIA
jgi:hypothetical protein